MSNQRLTGYWYALLFLGSLLLVSAGASNAEAAQVVDKNNGIQLKARNSREPGVVKITWQVSNGTLSKGGNYFDLEVYLSGRWRHVVGTAEPTHNGAPVYVRKSDPFCFRMIATKNRRGSILGQGTSGNELPCAPPPPPPDKDRDGVLDAVDNCPKDKNPSQLDTDGDGKGNACDKDDDNDLIPDSVEKANGLNPLDESDADLDKDRDGLSNLEDYKLGTDISTYDTDGDGAHDGYEAWLGTNPKKKKSVPKPVPMPWIPAILD
jgi:hypothetical protein